MSFSATFQNASNIPSGIRLGVFAAIVFSLILLIIYVILTTLLWKKIKTRKAKIKMTQLDEEINEINPLKGISIIGQIYNS